MKMNKMFWIIGLVLLVSVPSAFAYNVYDLVKDPWFMFAVNTLIILTLLHTIFRISLPKYLTDEKLIMWVVVGILSVVGGYRLGRDYIWNIAINLGKIFLTLPILINGIIIAASLYFGITLLGYEPKKGAQQWGFVIGVLLVS